MPDDAFDLPEDLREVVRAFRGGLPLPRNGTDVSDGDSLLSSLPAELQERVVVSQEAITPPFPKSSWYLLEYGDAEQPVLRRYTDLAPLLEKLMRLEGTDCFAHVFWGTCVPLTEPSSSGVRYLCISPDQYLPIPTSTREAKRAVVPVDASLLDLPTNTSGWLGDYAGHPDYPEGRAADLDPEADLGHYPGKKKALSEDAESDVVWEDDIFEVEADDDEDDPDDEAHI